MLKKMMFALFLSFNFASTSFGEDKLAVIELMGDNRALTSLITEDLHAAAKKASSENGFEVVSLTTSRDALGEKGLLTGCNKPKCIEKVVKSSKANLVLVGSIDANSFGFTLRIQMKRWPNLKTIKGDKIEHHSKMGLISAARSQLPRLFASIGNKQSTTQPRLSGFQAPTKGGQIAIAVSQAEPVKASDDCTKQSMMKVNIASGSRRKKDVDIYVDGQFKGKGEGPFSVSICAKLVEAESRYGIYASKLRGLLLPGIESTVNLKRFQKGKRGSRFNRININSASRNRLKQLPGIGDSEAKAILASRKKRGRFNHCRELVATIGISLENFERIAPVCIAK